MQLKIDVDGHRKLSRRELDRRARIAHVTITRVVDRRSPSGRGWHRRIEVEKSLAKSAQVGHRVRGRKPLVAGRCVSPPKGRQRFSPMEIVALQLLFGSDPIREAFNLHRARLVQAGQVSRFWARRWNTLYVTSGGR